VLHPDAYGAGFTGRVGLARIVGLPQDSRFSEITEKFAECADEFLKDVQAEAPW